MWPMEVVEEEAVALALTGDLAWSTWKGASEGAARMLIHTITVRKPETAFEAFVTLHEDEHV